MKISRILFPTDFSETASVALGRALFLAEALEAELHMLHAVVLHEFDPNDPESRFPDAEDIFRRLFEIGDSNMARLMKQHGRETLTIRQEQRRGLSAPSVILEYAEEIGADLIVMGTHGRRGAARVLLGSVAEAVVRHAPCPVLVVGGSAEAREVETVRRILVPVDFSEASNLTLRYAEALGHLHHAGLELLHVVADVPYPYYYMPKDEGSEKKMKRAHEALSNLASEAVSNSQKYEIAVRFGRVAQEIVDHVEEGDLMVIGTHGLTGLERVLVGSTAESVIREAHCPVFVVKSKGKVVL